MEQRFTFDGVAALYDAARPDYPSALFEDLIAAAKLGPDDAILEIGCGSGQATRRLAPRGFRIVALDPGAELIRVARERLGEHQNIEFVNATFEDWQLQPGRFQLVLAAQSFHWIAPDIAFVKTAQALTAGGHLAVFGNVKMPLASHLAKDF